MQENIALLQNFTISDTSLIFSDNYSEAEYIKQQSPQNLSLHAGKSKTETRFVSLHRSQESILAASQLPASLRAQSLIIPYFTADIKSTSLISSTPLGAGREVALFRIASTGVFRILTDLTSSSTVTKLVDINFKTLQGKGTGASANREFKNVLVQGHDRSILEMHLIGSGSQQANGTLTGNAAAKLIESDG